MSRIWLLVFLLAHWGNISIAQQSKIKATGMLVFFDNRMAFFKTSSVSLNGFLKSQKDTGIEVTNNYMIDKLLKMSDSVPVIARYQNDKGVIITDTVLFRAVPVKFSYTKKKSPYKSSRCTMGFEKDSLEHILDYVCISHDIAIVNIEPNISARKRRR